MNKTQNQDNVSKWGNIIQLIPALAVNIIIIHPWDVVFFPSGKQHLSGEQLALGKTTSQG
jgi:hypothetical protein